MWLLGLSSIFIGLTTFFLFRALLSYQRAADEDEKIAIVDRTIRSISRLAAAVVGFYCSGPFVVPVAGDLSPTSWSQYFLSNAHWIGAVLISILIRLLPLAIVIIAVERIWKSTSSPSRGDLMVDLQSNGRDFENLLFKHDPLSRQRREIRLLHLPKRGESHDLLRDNSAPEDGFLSDYYEDYHCTMNTVSLDKEPEYQALSYAWGPATPTCKIMVNNQPFWIASNLASAIHYLTGFGDVKIWIDAICINQKDCEEKSWQIEQMLHVYKQAKRVVVWLGESTVENMGGFDTLRQLNRLWESERNGEASPALQELIWELFRPTTRPLSSPSRKREKIDSIAALLSAKWWGRIWVAQELAVASEIVFVCGYDTVKSECISEFLNAWDRLGGLSRILDHRPWAHFEMRTRFRDSNNPLSIKDILQISAKAQLQATVSKDHVIGFSALTGNKVHYEQTYTSVFTDLAKRLIEESPDIWLLSYCILSPKSPLPSWVPDWSAQPGIPTILQAAGGYATGAASPFNASRNVKSSISIIGTTSPILQCKGIQVDIVSTVGTERSAGKYDHLDDETRRDLLAWFRNELPSLLLPSSRAADIDPDFIPAYTPKERNEAPFRTLLLDHWETPFAGWHIVHSRGKEIHDALVRENKLYTTIPSSDTEQFFNYAFRNTILRVPFVTKRGYLGLGSPQIKMGDVVVILGGGNVPYILRPVVSGTGANLYQLVGEAYVHGIMYGEAVAAKHEIKTFKII